MQLRLCSKPKTETPSLPVKRCNKCIVKERMLVIPADTPAAQVKGCSVCSKGSPCDYAQRANWCVMNTVLNVEAIKAGYT